MTDNVPCPHCGAVVKVFRNPVPTADIIIRVDGGIVLIKRKNPPYGWAMPGESAESAAVREAREETSLNITDLQQFGVYSDPDRDPRQHTLTVVFTAKAQGTPVAQDDAADIGVYTRDNLPAPLAFDHGKILDDFFRACENGGQT
jgi:ADP-ribose pyrophosphatase YjhB (NUDIX family)